MAERLNRTTAGRLSDLWIHLSEWIEMIFMKTLLTLTLWPLKLMYRRPRPDESWPAWQANQRLCRIDRRYC